MVQPVQLGLVLGSQEEPSSDPPVRSADPPTSNLVIPVLSGVVTGPEVSAAVVGPEVSAAVVDPTPPVESVETDELMDMEPTANGPSSRPFPQATAAMQVNTSCR